MKNYRMKGGNTRMAISEEAKKVTEYIYIAYGSSTGVLFGIPPAQRSAVEAIVQVAIDLIKVRMEETDDD